MGKDNKNFEKREIIGFGEKSGSMEAYWEWLCSIPGLYLSGQEVLLRCFSSPEGIWNATEQELNHLEEKGCQWIDCVKKFRRTVSPAEITHRNETAGIQFISREHTMYPDSLIPLKGMPYGLFYRGHLPVRDRKSVAVVGARMCTPSGREWARRISSEIILAGGQVISGAAYGIDGVAQWEALERGGGSFAVLGCGVDCCYPSSHARLFERLEREGGILSEFPPGTRPFRSHFPMRNRIISGLSDAVVVVEARKKSGSLITADFAAEQGKQVLAVPGRPEDELSQGCNDLIAHGAGIILSEESIVKELFPDYKQKKRKLSEDIVLAPVENLVYSSLDLHSKSLWELEECLPLSLADLSNGLLSLEMKGLIRETEHNFYARR